MDEVIPSDVDAPGFSIRTGHYLAWASNFAYEELGDWVQKLGLGRDTAVFTCGQFRGFVGHLGRCGVVAFRGTQNVGNCLTDLETPLVTHAAYPGHVHRGFAEAVDEVWLEVLRLLGPADRAKPLWVTGHSLGGAMATLAAVRLVNCGYTVRAAYTFGSPRVGDRLFRHAHRVAHYRFVNDNDLVPHTPFRWCYKHVGQLKLLDEEANLIEERSAWRLKKRALRGKAKCVQRAHRRPLEEELDLLEFDWLDDHRIERYLEAIAKILPRVPRRRVDGPHSRPGTPAEGSLRISDEALAEAFSRQPCRW